MRQRLNRRSIALVLALTALLTSTILSEGCAKAPPNLSPVGVAAFHAHEVVKVLDLVRDTAIAAEAQNPKLLSTDTTAKVVTWHHSALVTIKTVPYGWQGSVQAGLDEVSKNLPASERSVLGPYLSMARAVIREVAR